MDMAGEASTAESRDSRKDHHDDSFTSAIDTLPSEQTPLLPSTSICDPDSAQDERPRHQSIADSLLSQKPPSTHSLLTPQSWRSESFLLLTYSAPLIPTYLLQYFYSVVTIFVAGHISSDALAATSIGVTTMTIFGYAIFEGMATALDTLCAQAYGSGNLHRVGLHVQRMVLLMGVTAVPIAGFWLASPWLFPLFLKQEGIAILAGRFMQVSLIGLPGYAVFEALKRFLQAQGDFTSSLLVLIVCAPVNVLLNWLFVFKFGWGLQGTALAAAVTNLCRPALMLAWIFLARKWTLQCWNGFTKRAFQNWGPMVRLSAAGSILNLSEWAAFEILTFSTSYISSKHISAQTILTTTSVLVWHIPFSVGVAVTTRVGHLIGSGATKNAKRVATFYAVIFVAIGLFDAVLIWLLRNHVGRFFSDDEEVQAIVVAVAPVVATFQVIDSIIAGSSGVLRALGRQSIAAWGATIINYCAAVPIAIWLELGPAALGLKGCWLSLQCGMVVLAIVEVGSMKVMSWQRCVEDARTRNLH